MNPLVHPFHFRSLIRSLAMAALMTNACLAISESATGLNNRDDAGPSAAGNGVVSPLPAATPEMVQRFPVAQRGRVHVIGGGFRGFGMLAQFGEGGPAEIVVTRKTKSSDKEPYTPIALARVFDPNGTLVAVEEFTNQKNDIESRVLTVPKGVAGIWRVSFSGGRAGDWVEIRLPKTDVWGVRGEMALGVSETTPRPAYLWMAPTSKRLLIGVEAGTLPGMELQSATGAVLGKPEADPTKRPGRIFLPNAPANTVCRLVLPAKFSGAFVIEGTPGLLCPTETAALALRGGTVESHGLLMSGPLQARARNWMVATAAGLDRKLNFQFPKEVPADLKSLPVQALAFGKSGFVNTINSVMVQQNAHLDPSDPAFGGFSDPKTAKSREIGWVNFWPPSPKVNFESAGLAGAATFPSPFNTAYGNVELIKRATLGSLVNIASMQGDDLLREGALDVTRYPVTHAFFVYPPALAQSFHALKDRLAPEEKEIWRQGLMAAGDKMADYQGYESNQWAHMMIGHLETYLGTGEKRFLRYFESQANAYFDCKFGPYSKFGQHPAGFYLEENGPDGNYDKLNSYCIAACYYEYRDLPEADPVLVEKMRAGIEKNLRFASFFWLPEPGGEVTSPNAFNCRTTARLGAAGYPGVFMTKSDFALGQARFELTPAPKRSDWNSGYAYLANTDAWAMDIIKSGLAAGSMHDGPACSWLTHLVKTYSLPQKVQAAVIPIKDEGKTWTLPGLLAWNRQSLYGVVFYDVEGTRSVLNGFVGGGPSALWTPATGSFIQALSPGKPSTRITTKQEQSTENGLTWSCVYGRDASGALVYSGKERSELKVITPDRTYEIRAKMVSPAAELVWRYDFHPEELTISVEVSPASAAKGLNVNLPVNVRSIAAKLESAHAVTCSAPGGSVRIDWPATVTGKLEPSVHNSTSRLVLPLPVDGSPLSIRFKKAAGTGSGGAPVSVTAGQPAENAPVEGD